MLLFILVDLVDYRYTDSREDNLLPPIEQTMLNRSSDVYTRGSHFILAGRGPGNASGAIDPNDTGEDFVGTTAVYTLN